MAILRFHVQFFLCCVCWYCGLVLSPDESPDSLSASWDDTGRARSSNREVFSINTDLGAISLFQAFRDLDQGQKPISSGFTLGMRSPDFFLACVQFSPPLKLSHRSLRGGGGTQEFTSSEQTACSRRSDSGVRYEGRDGEKDKEEKRERALTPTPSPLCLFVCFFFSAYIFFTLSPRSALLEQDSEQSARKIDKEREKKTTTTKTQQQQTRGVSFYLPTINSRWPTLNAALDHMNALEQAIHRFFFFFCVGALPPLCSHTA